MLNTRSIDLGSKQTLILKVGTGPIIENLLVLFSSTCSEQEKLRTPELVLYRKLHFHPSYRSHLIQPMWLISYME